MAIIHYEPEFRASNPIPCRILKKDFFLVKFIVENTTRLIVSYHREPEHGHGNGHEREEEGEETITTEIPNNPPTSYSASVFVYPDDKPSWEKLRSALRDSVRCTRYEGRVLRQVADYVSDVVKRLSRLRAAGDITDGDDIALGVVLHVIMKRVFVQRDRVFGPRAGGPIPADEAAVEGSLRKVEVGELEEGEKCGVCLEEFKEKEEEEVTCLPCEHVFHEGCIVKWLKTSHFCPLCRFELPVQKLSSSC